MFVPSHRSTVSDPPPDVQRHSMPPMSSARAHRLSLSGADFEGGPPAAAVGAARNRNSLLLRKQAAHNAALEAARDDVVA